MTTAARFDVIFFSAWLSHVPAGRFEQFWQLLRGLLAEGGRVLFVDEPVENRAKETYLPAGDEIVERRLRDGSRYRIVKNSVDPERLERRLRGLGWECQIRRDLVAQKARDLDAYLSGVAGWVAVNLRRD